MGSKPPAAVVVRISKDGRDDLGAASPLLTTTSSLQGRVGGLSIIPKLVELVIGPGSTRQAEKLSPCIACTAVATPSVRSRIFVFAGPSASMARRGCRASCSGVSNADLYLSALEEAHPCSCPTLRKLLSSFDIHPPAWVGQTQILLAGGRDHCPRGQPRSPSVAC